MMMGRPFRKFVKSSGRIQLTGWTRGYGQVIPLLHKTQDGSVISALKHRFERLKIEFIRASPI